MRYFENLYFVSDANTHAEDFSSQLIEGSSLTTFSGYFSIKKLPCSNLQGSNPIYALYNQNTSDSSISFLNQFLISAELISIRTLSLLDRHCRRIVFILEFS